MTPVLLVPGWSGRAAVDYPFLGPMLARHRAMREVDLTALPAPTLEHLAHAVVAAAAPADADATPPALVGVGFGALVAVAAAAAHPTRFSSLIAVSGWLVPPPKLVAFCAAWAESRRAGLDPHALVSAATVSAEGWRPIPATTADAATDRLVALAAHADVEAAAAALTLPSLVVTASRDALIGAGASRLLAAALPGARTAEIAAGHASWLERPAQVLALVESFVDDPAGLPAGAAIATVTP